MRKVTDWVACEPIPINKVGGYGEGTEGNTTLPIKCNDVKSEAILDSRAGVAIAAKKIWALLSGRFYTNDPSNVRALWNQYSSSEWLPVIDRPYPVMLAKMRYSWWTENDQPRSVLLLQLNIHCGNQEWVETDIPCIPPVLICDCLMSIVAFGTSGVFQCFVEHPIISIVRPHGSCPGGLHFFEILREVVVGSGVGDLLLDSFYCVNGRFPFSAGFWASGKGDCSFLPINIRIVES